MEVLEHQVPELTSDAVTAFPAPEADRDRPMREVRHEYTRNLPSILEGLNASLLVSTYQAGKVVGVGVFGGELALSYHNFERAMGVAVRSGVIAVGARAQIWFLHGAPDLRPASSRMAATTPVSSPGRRGSPARSRGTSWPGRARISGSSTRLSPACARCTRSTASSRDGGRRSSRR